MDELINTVNSSVDEIDLKMNQIQQLLNNNDLEGAKHIANEILKIDSNDINAHFILAQIAEANEDFNLAAEHFEAVIKFQETPELIARLAQVSEECDNYERAYELYKQVFELEPEDKNLCERLAHVSRILGKNAEAIDFYNKLLTIESDDIVALTQLMELYEESNRLMYYLTRARIQEIEGANSYAAESLQKALNLAENNEDIIPIRFKLAENLAGRDKALQAIDQYLFILEQDQTNFDVYKKLADLYISLDNSESAIETFERALHIYPDDIEVLGELADLHLDEEHYEKAQELYTKLVEFEPENKENNVNLAKAQLQLKNLDAAYNNLQQVLAVNEKDIPALTVLIDYYSLQQNYDEATQVANKIKELLPSSPLAYRKLAEINEKLNNAFEVHYNYAKFHELKGEKQLAVDEYTWALGQQPDNTNIVIKLAGLYEDLGEKYIAIEYYEKAFNLDSSLTHVLSKASDIYFKQKDYEQAKNLYEKLLAVDDKDTELYYNLAICYENTKDYEKALGYYKKYDELAPLSNKSEEVKKKVQSLESKIYGSEDEGFINKLFKMFKN